jgi:hypothetical protein
LHVERLLQCSDQARLANLVDGRGSIVDVGSIQKPALGHKPDRLSGGAWISVLVTVDRK